MGLPLSGFDSFGQALPTHPEDNTIFPQGNALGILGFYGVQIKRGVTLAATLAALETLAPPVGTLVYVVDGRKTDEAAGMGTGLHGFVASSGPTVIKNLA